MDYADKIADRLWPGNGAPAVMTAEDMRAMLARAAREGYNLHSGVAGPSSQAGLQSWVGAL